MIILRDVKIAKLEKGSEHLQKKAKYIKHKVKILALPAFIIEWLIHNVPHPSTSHFE